MRLMTQLLATLSLCLTTTVWAQTLECPTHLPNQNPNSEIWAGVLHPPGVANNTPLSQVDITPITKNSRRGLIRCVYTDPRWDIPGLLLGKYTTIVVAKNQDKWGKLVDPEHGFKYYPCKHSAKECAVQIVHNY